MHHIRHIISHTKSTFIGTMFVLAMNSATPQSAPLWTSYNVEPSSLVAEAIDGGEVQIEAYLLYADNKVSGYLRSAVIGCLEGRGRIAEVDDNGKARSPWRPWSQTGTSLRDFIAKSICLVAAYHPVGARPANRPGDLT